MADCLLECLREVQLERYYRNFTSQGLHSCEALVELSMQDYAEYGVISMKDRLRLFKLIQIVKSVQDEGLFCSRHSGSESKIDVSEKKNASKHDSISQKEIVAPIKRENSVNPATAKPKQSNVTTTNPGFMGPGKFAQNAFFAQGFQSKKSNNNQMNGVTKNGTVSQIKTSHKDSKPAVKSERTFSSKTEVIYSKGSDTPIFKCRKTLHFSDLESDDESPGQRPLSARTSNESPPKIKYTPKKLCGSSNHQHQHENVKVDFTPSCSPDLPHSASARCVVIPTKTSPHMAAKQHSLSSHSSTAVSSQHTKSAFFIEPLRTVKSTENTGVSHAYFPPKNTPSEIKEIPVEKVFHNTQYNYGVPNSASGVVETFKNVRTPYKGSNQKICVCVRKRPLTVREVKRQEVDVIQVTGRHNLIVEENKLALDLTRFVQQHLFQFDTVFSESHSNEEVFEQAVKPLLSHILRGSCAACFAFGQTGAGKSYTLLGTRTVPGMYQLAAQDLFMRLEKDYTARPAPRLWVSYYEIYCGQLYDLLNKRKRLHARENAQSKVCITGLMETQVLDVKALVDVIQYGNVSRSKGSSGVNPNSSRSHAVLQLELRDSRDVRVGKISFIDLAGSEKAADAGDSDRQTRVEGAEINQSLLALKECIRSIDQDSRHTPYRQSKLTHILRDSFLGNSRTVMIANISPTQSSTENTLNTLNYADRVKELRSRTQKTPKDTSPHVPASGTPSRSAKKSTPSLFHPSSIQCSSTPKENKPNRTKSRTEQAADHVSLALQDAYDTPIRGHQLTRSHHRKSRSGGELPGADKIPVIVRREPVLKKSPHSGRHGHRHHGSHRDTERADLLSEKLRHVSGDSLPDRENDNSEPSRQSNSSACTCGSDKKDSGLSNGSAHSNDKKESEQKIRRQLFEKCKEDIDPLPLNIGSRSEKHLAVPSASLHKTSAAQEMHNQIENESEAISRCEKHCIPNTNSDILDTSKVIMSHLDQVIIQAKEVISQGHQRHTSSRESVHSSGSQGSYQHGSSRESTQLTGSHGREGEHASRGDRYTSSSSGGNNEPDNHNTAQQHVEEPVTSILDISPIVDVWAYGDTGSGNVVTAAIEGSVPSGNDGTSASGAHTHYSHSRPDVIDSQSLKHPHEQSNLLSKETSEHSDISTRLFLRNSLTRQDNGAHGDNSVDRVTASSTSRKLSFEEHVETISKLSDRLGQIDNQDLLADSRGSHRTHQYSRENSQDSNTGKSSLNTDSEHSSTDKKKLVSYDDRHSIHFSEQLVSTESVKFSEEMPVKQKIEDNNSCDNQKLGFVAHQLSPPVQEVTGATHTGPVNQAALLQQAGGKQHPAATSQPPVHPAHPNVPHHHVKKIHTTSQHEHQRGLMDNSDQSLPPAADFLKSLAESRQARRNLTANFTNVISKQGSSVESSSDTDQGMSTAPDKHKLVKAAHLRPFQNLLGSPSNSRTRTLSQVDDNTVSKDSGLTSEMNVDQIPRALLDMSDHALDTYMQPVKHKQPETLMVNGTELPQRLTSDKIGISRQSSHNEPHGDIDRVPTVNVDKTEEIYSSNPSTQSMIHSCNDKRTHSNPQSGVEQSAPVSKAGHMSSVSGRDSGIYTDTDRISCMQNRTFSLEEVVDAGEEEIDVSDTDTADDITSLPKDPPPTYPKEKQLHIHEDSAFTKVTSHSSPKQSNKFNHHVKAHSVPSNQNLPDNSPIQTVKLTGGIVGATFSPIQRFPVTPADTRTITVPRAIIQKSLPDASHRLSQQVPHTRPDAAEQPVYTDTVMPAEQKIISNSSDLQKAQAERHGRDAAANKIPSDTGEQNTEHENLASSSRHNNVEQAADTTDQTAQGILVMAHEDQLAQITTLCKQEMRLLYGLRSQQLKFDDYVEGLQNVLASKVMCVSDLSSQLHNYTKRSAKNKQK